MQKDSLRGEEKKTSKKNSGKGRRDHSIWLQRKKIRKSLSGVDNDQRRNPRKKGEGKETTSTIMHTEVHGEKKRGEEMHHYVMGNPGGRDGGGKGRGTPRRYPYPTFYCGEGQLYGVKTCFFRWDVLGKK